nr:aminotransferase class V-fold PLP-dependent enzyme [Streptomyces sp. SID13588]
MDLPPLTAARFAGIERRVAALLDTEQDVVITQGEALLPLEGCIRGGARPGSAALNVVTGPYGKTFGDWLRDAGAEVTDLAVPFHGAVSAEQVERALAEHPEIDFVSLVHAEAATGNTNPVAEIGEVVRAHGALFMLDAVASVAAEPLLPDAWGVDLCVIGAQKAMGGPAGVSAVSVSARAWERMAANPAAPRRSYLSLLDRYPLQTHTLAASEHSYAWAPPAYHGGTVDRRGGSVLARTVRLLRAPATPRFRPRTRRGMRRGEGLATGETEAPTGLRVALTLGVTLRALLQWRASQLRRIGRTPRPSQRR